MLVLILLFAFELASRYRWASDTLEMIEPRYARLAGVQRAGDAIVKRRQDASEALARFAHAPDTEVPRIGTDLQQRIRRIAEEYDVRVSGSQIMPAREEGALMTISINASMDGEVGAIAELLASLEAEQPPVLVDSLRVQAPRARRRGDIENRVSVQSTLSVLRLTQ
ncbi:MAG: hypothetical protein H2060_08015 [Azoarcus sp.]|nr:hypothetical protein [Azoarcus sp.]